MERSKYSDSAACDRCARERLYRNLTTLKTAKRETVVCSDTEDCAASLLAAPHDTLENAVWLREHPAGLIGSALHGGKAKGFQIATSHVTTDAIRAALAVAS